ncbi:protein of unknown function [Paraburkholderia dioscoreae]|uniref:Uncharacterized protein n=1 Tax=Paraburkholderia dioscoreae TaxID=2604047 RepID=A0A5Q4Z1Z9_9BURK|nr:protein of unknown function [Paraburkholderia dioscoreae]
MVGLRGRLIGMLSGLLDPLEPDADSGGLTIDELSPGAVVCAVFCVGCSACCACPGFAVCANVAVPLVPAIASAALAVSTVHLLRSIAVLLGDAACRFRRRHADGMTPATQPACLDAPARTWPAYAPETC